MHIRERIVTAGVYVLVDGLFVFQVGPTKSGETLGVVRIGGHREEHETSWECATREALEEASLHISHLTPPATYWGRITGEREEQPAWYTPDAEGIAPLLVTRRVEEYITPIYLVYSHDTPEPNAEARALLLLRPGDIQLLATETITLKDYLARGGKALFRETLPEHLMLEPFGHLCWLHTLLQLHPEIASIK